MESFLYINLNKGVPQGIWLTVEVKNIDRTANFPG